MNCNAIVYRRICGHDNGIGSNPITRGRPNISTVASFDFVGPASAKFQPARRPQLACKSHACRQKTRPCSRTCNGADSRARQQSSWAPDISVAESDRGELAEGPGVSAQPPGNVVTAFRRQGLLETEGKCARRARERLCPRGVRLHQAVMSREARRARHSRLAAGNGPQFDTPGTHS